jgi:glycosyltransferase involved in cell wall biosynthesis
MSVLPKVSVLMITYKHERFIAQALESVLMQEVDFPFEVVVGEDNSPDGTLKVVEEYRRQHPDKIRLIARERNLGSGNFVETYAACRGKYVAILEGDDYWTSSEKLQVQADALDARADWVLCFHGVQVVHDDGREPQYMFPPGRREVFTLDDLLRSNFIPTCSTMFRNRMVVRFPEWYASLAMGDWPFYILLAQHGQLGYLDRVMGTYRVHRGGIWTSKEPWFKVERCLEMLSQVRQILDRSRCQRLTSQIVSGYIELAAEQMQTGQVSAARSTLWGLLRRESVLQRGFPYRDALRAVLEIEAPNVLGMIRWIRWWTR